MAAAAVDHHANFEEKKESPVREGLPPDLEGLQDLCNLEGFRDLGPIEVQHSSSMLLPLDAVAPAGLVPSSHHYR